MKAQHQDSSDTLHSGTHPKGLLDRVPPASNVHRRSGASLPIVPATPGLRRARRKRLESRLGQDGSLYQVGKRQTDHWLPDKPAYLRIFLDVPGQHERKNFYPIVLPAGVLDQELKGLWLSGRTLVTDKPDELAIDDVPVLEFSLIDITEIKADEAAMADTISRAWTKFQLKSEGWFVLRLRQNGKHQIEFPE